MLYSVYTSINVTELPEFRPYAVLWVCENCTFILFCRKKNENEGNDGDRDRKREAEKSHNPHIELNEAFLSLWFYYR